jgi:hypothetical protein
MRTGQPSPYSEKRSHLYQVTAEDYSEAELRLQEIYALKRELDKKERTIKAQAEALDEARESNLELRAEIEQYERNAASFAEYSRHYGN